MGKIPDQVLDDIRACVPIADVVGPYVSWDKKKSNVARQDFWACCPFHAENSPSFHADNRRNRFHCFGCGASGDHFRFLQEVRGIHFLDAVRELAETAGVDVSPWIGKGRELTEQEKQEYARRQEQLRRDKEQKAADAERRAAEKAGDIRAIWQAAKPIAGTLGEQYLLNRGIPMQEWPASIRFSPGLTHPFTKQRFACLACATQAADRKLIGLKLICLDPDLNPATKGKAAVDPDKPTMGPVGGGAVRLAAATDAICITEGVETAFAVKALLGDRWPVWAALSTSGIMGFVPPPEVKHVKIYADGDRHKFRRDGQVSEPQGPKAAEALAARLVEAGIEHSIHLPPAGMDWLDVWNETREAST